MCWVPIWGPNCMLSGPVGLKFIIQVYGVVENMYCQKYESRPVRKKMGTGYQIIFMECSAANDDPSNTAADPPFWSCYQPTNMKI